MQGTTLETKVLTFDMYGTLIDWESGLSTALQQVFHIYGINKTESEALQLYAYHEADVSSGDYLPYREVLSKTLEQIGLALGFTPREEDLTEFANSISDWPAFKDSQAALLRLKEHFKLAVITNCDDEHFAISNRKLGIEFDYIITAELARSYKPSLNNFLLALGSIGVPNKNILHIAESLFHDHVPAKKLGLSSVWINRRHGKPGKGATLSATATPDAEYTSMKDFTDAILNQVNYNKFSST
ncbi:haloacid dehalogenase type II [Acinetobacter sp. ME22]|uniref:haloacid dehalogenase type II n=1 Tax=Acinetobacter sp. ME22 TaxID=2904802 RepID=UPI001ED9DFF2|nr:haloacid dehalogenase type II [Acinetobacter sp. ME22]MCG2574783.1 haloacid dehalogenase type II [Acinetobacter sp. ME22]